MPAFWLAGAFPALRAVRRGTAASCMFRLMNSSRPLASARMDSVQSVGAEAKRGRRIHIVRRGLSGIQPEGLRGTEPGRLLGAVGSPFWRFGPSPAAALHREAGQAILGVGARIVQEWPGGRISQSVACSRQETGQ